MESGFFERRSKWFAAGVLDASLLSAGAWVAGPMGPMNLPGKCIQYSFNQNAFQEDSKVEPGMVKTVSLNYAVGGFARDLAQSFRTGL